MSQEPSTILTETIPEMELKKPVKESPQRPRSSWAQVISASCSCVALFGLYGIWYQAGIYNKQEQRESDRRVRDAYAKLYSMDMDIWKYIGQTPKLVKAFFDDKDGTLVGMLSEEERGRFAATCQMVGDMFEYYLLIEPDLEGNDWGNRNNCWKSYMAMIHERSHGFKEYIKATESEWTEVFLNRLKEVSAHKKAT